MIHIAHTGFSPAYVVSGLLVGLLVGLTGVGGGSLMTPLLVLLFGFHPSTAVGTDLLFAASTKSAGTLLHNAGKSVDWRVVGRLALGSIPATAIALAVIAHYGATSHVITETMSLVLGVALLLSAASLLIKDRIIRLAERRNPDFGLQTSLGLTILVGFVVGLLVSLSSVGAGALGTVSLLFLYPRMSSVRVVGSDIAHAVPLTLIAGLGHWYLGSIDFPLLGTLLLGSIPGILLGSWAAQHMPENMLRPSLGVVLALVGVKMLSAL
ncbi:sulfite exporter TauE/SafE family protein [Frateuria aurantia]